MILRPFFSFYGSKWRLTPNYPAATYDTIIEPFAGSAGYSLHYPEKQIILVERDPQIAAVWRWLIAASTDDILSLPRLKQGDNLNDYEMPQEARWLMGLWVDQAQGNPRNIVTKFGANYAGEAEPGSNCGNYIKRVPDQLRYIRHWVIIEDSYWGAPNTTATWFIDPPYQVAGLGHYRLGPKTIDYNHLARWCQQRNGQTIVCESADADWLPFSELTSVRRSPTNKSKLRAYKEVVWLN